MKRLKQLGGVLVLVLTLVLFVYYWRGHPEVWQQLQQLKLVTVLKILALYACMTAALICAYQTLLRLCKLVIPFQENLLLTIYSTIANFFGPLQSGPGVRTAYLKNRHKLSIRAYASVTLLYYCLFTGISGLFLLASAPGWLLAVAIAAALAIGITAIFILRKRLEPVLLLQLASFTLLQLSFTVLVYYVELQSLNAHVSFLHTLSYAGAANFALFVSLTPGALGFRESFLLLSQRLHHVDSNTIVAANVIDRGVYVLFLGICFGLVVALHAKDRFGIGGTKPQKYSN